MVKNIHLLNRHMLKMHIGIASIRKFQCVQKTTTYVTVIKETYFEIYSKQVSCPLASPLLNILNCQSVYKNTCHHIANCYIYMTAISPNLIS